MLRRSRAKGLDHSAGPRSGARGRACRPALQAGPPNVPFRLLVSSSPFCLEELVGLADAHPREAGDRVHELTWIERFREMDLKPCHERSLALVVSGAR